MTTAQGTQGDARLMDRAFALAERARGRVSPNPFVGCVITDRAGRVVGEGWTQPPGQAHAEVMALAAAGEQARGGTAHVTLEPCNHTGRTPPCSDALIQAGIATVVHALADPSPVAAGGGAALVAAGVTVHGDVAVQAARRQNEIFLHCLEAGRPFVVLKSAMSLDGRTADHAGTSQWITGPEARAAGHRVRAEVDAILVGSQTALDDDPSLTVRLAGYDGPQPLRVVLDRRGRIGPAELTMQTDGLGTVLVLDGATPEAVLERLWARDVRSVLVEGGPGIATAFVAADLVDRFELHHGNVLLGTGSPMLRAAWDLPTAPRLRLVSADLSGDDVVVVAYPRRD